MRKSNATDARTAEPTDQGEAARSAQQPRTRLEAALEVLDRDWAAFDDRDDQKPPEESFKVPHPVKRFIRLVRAESQQRGGLDDPLLMKHVGHLLGVLPDGVLVCDTCEADVASGHILAAPQPSVPPADPPLAPCTHCQGGGCAVCYGTGQTAVPPADPPSDAVAILAAAQAAIDSLPPSMKNVPPAESREAEALRLLSDLMEWAENGPPAEMTCRWCLVMRGTYPAHEEGCPIGAARSFLQAASTSSAGADE